MTIDASEISAILKSEIKDLGEDPKISYADRDGKYMNQVGITLAKSKY